MPGVDGYFDEDGRPINAPLAPTAELSDSAPLLGKSGEDALADVKAIFRGEPNETAAKATFATAKELFVEKKYDEAEDAFAAAAQQWPKSRLAQDALFLQAESQFFSDQYPAASESYARLVTDYPHTRHLDQVVRRQAAIARFWVLEHQEDPSWSIEPNLTNKTLPRFDTIGRALKTYESIRLNDPTGPLADDALMATANIHFQRHRFADADYHYELLRREYPNSEHQLMAHILGLEAKLRKYQGKEYDGTPLEEAEQLVKQLRIQFTTDLDDDQRERINELSARVTRERASRDFFLAGYFEGREQYGAARYYYEQVAANYPQTGLADEARTRMAAISEEPAVAPEKLEWLVKWMPENEERKMLAIPPRQAPVRR